MEEVKKGFREILSGTTINDLLGQDKETLMQSISTIEPSLNNTIKASKYMGYATES